MGPADAHVQGQGKGAEDRPGPHVLRWLSGHHRLQSGHISIDGDQARYSSGESVPWETMSRGPR